VLWARRKRERDRPELVRAAESLRKTASEVDRAKDSLLLAVPRRRGPGLPVAEALSAFEDHLRAAETALADWPVGIAGDERDLCVRAVAESLRRSEALRLQASPEGYEELYAALGDVMDPLDALADVGGRLTGGSS
jgi:hypothetical protein